MKKLFFLILALLIVVPFAQANELTVGQTAEVYEHPHGRSVVADKSELLTIWYTGSSASSGFGVSGTTNTGNLGILFYEAGAVNTTNRFNGSTYDEVSLYNHKTSESTANTVQGVVDSINSDASGEFHAAIGRDATPGTATNHSLAADVILGISNREDDAIDNSHVVFEDTSSSDTLRAGFRAQSGTVNRLKQVSHNLKSGAASAALATVETVTMKVWDQDEVVWIELWSSLNYATATATTIYFANYDAKGLCSHEGNNLTVVFERDTLMGTTEGNSNLSILVGEWKE